MNLTHQMKVGNDFSVRIRLSSGNIEIDEGQSPDHIITCLANCKGEPGVLGRSIGNAPEV